MSESVEIACRRCYGTGKLYTPIKMDGKVTYICQDCKGTGKKLIQRAAVMSDCKHENMAEGQYETFIDVCDECGDSELDILRDENKELKTDYGLLEISRDHERTLRISCEQALAGRDKCIRKLEAELTWFKAIYPNHPKYKLPKESSSDA